MLPVYISYTAIGWTTDNDLGMSYDNVLKAYISAQKKNNL